ncbi:MAG: hypothetical protein DWQ42_07830 [Planctomycetota bacterium]|nr:MAG: hypothetical protein DWQ42_07830 [Planctomycetota bacterium]REK44316.1 MAG: hypothetical protein DWQ46_10130 [Planctomycetota bacterium]
MHCGREFTRRRRAVVVLGVLSLVLSVAGSAIAGPPWANFVTFKRIEADPDKSYPLGEEHGPWLILATTFRGPDAETNARQLVYELRRDYKLNAYTHQKSFDYSKSFVGRGVDRYGNPTRMRHQNNQRIDEVAVVIGDFVSLDDTATQKTLERVKTMRPRVFDPDGEQEPTDALTALRDFHNRLWGQKQKRERGPMWMAFAIPNPRLPKSYFRPQGVDKFVAQLNEDREFSLLECPKAYTVRVATFTGHRATQSTERGDTAPEPEVTDRLEKAAFLADHLAAGLRKHGVEAYVFHDRTQSIVTVGSFDAHGAQRMKDGTIRYNPDVEAVIHNFAAIRPGGANHPLVAAGRGQGRVEWRNRIYDAELTSNIPGLENFRYRTFDGTPFDIEPTVIDVPRRSIARDYASLPKLFR